MKTDFLHDMTHGFSLMLQYDLSDGFLKWTYSFWNPGDTWNPEMAKDICQKRADIPGNRYSHSMFMKNGTRITDIKKTLIRFCREYKRTPPLHNHKNRRRNYRHDIITIVNYLLNRFEDVAA